MHKMFCVIGDNDNKDYEAVVEVEVKGRDAYAITHTYEDDNEKIYDDFCDRIERENNLPRSWYFDKIEDRGEC